MVPILALLPAQPTMITAGRMESRPRHHKRNGGFRDIECGKLPFDRRGFRGLFRPVCIGDRLAHLTRMLLLTKSVALGFDIRSCYAPRRRLANRVGGEERERCLRLY